MGKIKRSQFQGSKKKARRTAYLKRCEKRKRNQEWLPVLVEKPKKEVALIPAFSTPVLFPYFVGNY